MADGHRAYDGLGPGVLRVSCLAHIRRRFHDIVRCGRGPGRLARAQAPVAWEAIDRIVAMYRADGAFDTLGDAERLEARRRDLAPLVRRVGGAAARPGRTRDAPPLGPVVRRGAVAEVQQRPGGCQRGRARRQLGGRTRSGPSRWAGATGSSPTRPAAPRPRRASTPSSRPRRRMA